MERPAVYVTQLEKQLGNKLAVAVEALEHCRMMASREGLSNETEALNDIEGAARTALSRCNGETAVEGERK